ncbi:MAG: FAD:protein FMN transferase, partial [Armatimonadota bacterium]
MDPRTGLPVAHIRSASVIAPSAADTDALATVFSVLQPDESILLADSLPGVGCLLIGRTGQVWRSAEWRNREVSAGRIQPR